MNISESQRRFEILQKEIEETQNRKTIGNIDSFVDLGLDIDMSDLSDMEVIEE